MALLQIELSVVKSFYEELSMKTRWKLGSFSRHWVCAQVNTRRVMSPWLANRVEILTENRWRV